MRNTSRYPAALMLFAALAAAGGSAAQEPPQAQAPSFLRLTDAQRFWWFEGAFRATAHLVGMHDKAKGECVVKWYLDDRDAKRKLIEQTMAKYPREGETTIILGLLTQACGPLMPTAVR